MKIEHALRGHWQRHKAEFGLPPYLFLLRIGQNVCLLVKLYFIPLYRCSMCANQACSSRDGLSGFCLAF
nr:MAG TPA: hypothetical protein [Caudoviricetes sp.]